MKLILIGVLIFISLLIIFMLKKDSSVYLNIRKTYNDLCSITIKNSPLSQPILSSFCGDSIDNVLRCINSSLSQGELTILNIMMSNYKDTKSFVRSLEKEQPSLFSKLVNCGFISILGKIVALVAWNVNKKETPLEVYLQNLKSTDFNNLSRWDSFIK